MEKNDEVIKNMNRKMLMLLVGMIVFIISCLILKEYYIVAKSRIIASIFIGFAGSAMTGFIYDKLSN